MMMNDDALLFIFKNKNPSSRHLIFIDIIDPISNYGGARLSLAFSLTFFILPTTMTEAAADMFYHAVTEASTSPSRQEDEDEDDNDSK